MVRIAFATEDERGLDSRISTRFGRAPTITVVEVDEGSGEVKSVKVLKNPGAEAASGAGVKAAETVANAGATVYAGPNPGPNAYLALQHFGIKVVTVTGATVREALPKVLEELKSSGS